MNTEIKGLVFKDERDMERMEVVSEENSKDDKELTQFSMDFRLPALLSLVILATTVFHYYGPHSTSLVDTIQCPTHVKQAENFDQDSFNEAYNEETKKLTSNVTKFLETFRTEGFDNWGHTYEDVKKGMHKWKATKFPPNIKSGETIFESACGIGLNLYMTLEILAESGITNLQVFGNEYLPLSANKANVVFEHAPPSKAKLGKICAADSTDLSFVPSDSFHLVYTGYISPLLDPIDFNTGDVDENYSKYEHLCEMKNDTVSQKVVELAQEKQNTFYGKWVAEMVRIAKPGAAIIIEQVSFPYCEEYWDWGGVNTEWWLPAIDMYGWDIDPNSIEMETDTIFKHRYHVFLRKNGAKR
mmetsp:Transcript_10952/g.15670  ORF Transcript_10952/g.15670 Transcript_10952/m.15670 type:complete len:357 (-) Transcript_10952:50-1120(-)